MRSDDDKRGPPLHEDKFSIGELRHSGLGIASVILFVLACASWTGCLVAANIDSAQRAIKKELTQAAVNAMVFGCGSFLLLSIGASLGGSGLCQQGRKILFAYLGVALNCAGLFVLVVLANWENLIAVFGGP